MLRTAIAALLLVAGLPVAAGAQPAPSARVAYRDLNLSSPQDVKAFDRRIARAVKLVCPAGNDTSVRAVIEVAQCRGYAQDKVAEQRLRVLTTTAPSATVAVAR